MNVSREWLEKDYYRVLGVSPDASEKEITRAYRKLARELHPDANPGDATAEERFKEISAAYDIIGDPERRAKYDEVRRLGPMAAGPTGSGPGSTFRFDFDDDLSDLFGGLFTDAAPFGAGRRRGGRTRARRGQDQEARLQLSFEEAVRGVTTEVTVRDGSGDRALKVRIPAGVDDGQRIRLRGKGSPGIDGGPPGDLYVVVGVTPHPFFGRHGPNLTITLPITFTEAALGADVKVPTFAGDPVTLRIPPGTSSGKRFRVRGRGVKTDTTTGDLLVDVQIAVPSEPTAQQREALEALRAAEGPSPRSHLGGMT